MFFVLSSFSVWFLVLIMTRGQIYNHNCPVYDGSNTTNTTLGLTTASTSSNNETYMSGCLDLSLCTSYTTMCTEEYAPVCGCDNHTYSNLCFAHKNAINMSTPGVCNVTNTTFVHLPAVTLPDVPIPPLPGNLPIPVKLPILPGKFPILPISPVLPIFSGGKGTGTGVRVNSVQPTAPPTPGFRPVGDPSTLAPPHVSPPPIPETLQPTTSPTTETVQPIASPTLLANTTNTNTTNTTNTIPTPLHHLSNPSTPTHPMMQVSSASRTWHRLSFAQLFSKDIKWIYDVTKYRPRSRRQKTPMEPSLFDQSTSEKDHDKDQDKNRGQRKTKASSYYQRRYQALRWCVIEVLSWTVLSNYQLMMMFITQSHHFSWKAWRKVINKK